MPQDCYECVLSIEYALVILEINSDEIQVVLEATRLAILTEERDESPISFNEWRSEQSLMALFGCTAYYAWRSVSPSIGPSIVSCCPSSSKYVQGAWPKVPVLALRENITPSSGGLMRHARFLIILLCAALQFGTAGGDADSFVVEETIHGTLHLPVYI